MRQQFCMYSANKRHLPFTLRTMVCADSSENVFWQKSSIAEYDDTFHKKKAYDLSL